MSRSSLLALSTLLSALSFPSIATEYCPIPEKISIHGAVYKVSTDDGVSDKWLGVAPSGTSNEPVSQFTEAVAYQEEEQSIRFGKCSYRLSNGATVDLNYKPEHAPITVTLVQDGSWEKRRGPFGVIYYACDKKAPQACQFTAMK